MSSTYPRSRDTFTDKVNQGVVITAEEHTIPASAPYTVTLDSVPRGPETQSDGTQSDSTLSIVGFTEVLAGSPNPGQFITNYDTGVLTFNSADANTLIQANYETLGDLVLAEHINDLQDSMGTVQLDLLGSHRGLKAIVSTSGSAIDIFGGTYGRGGLWRTFVGVTNQSDASWATAGTYFVYIDNSDTLVLAGSSFPNNGIPIAQVTTASGGSVTSVEDSRVQINGGGGSAGVASGILGVYLVGVMSLTGGNNSDGYYFGSATDGLTFGSAVTITMVTLSAITAPTGADIRVTIRNVTQATSTVVILSASSQIEETLSLSLSFSSTDKLAVQVTQVGSTVAGGDINLLIHYE